MEVNSRFPIQKKENEKENEKDFGF